MMRYDLQSKAANYLHLNTGIRFIECIPSVSTAPYGGKFKSLRTEGGASSSAQNPLLSSAHSVMYLSRSVSLFSHELCCKSVLPLALFFFPSLTVTPKCV